MGYASFREDVLERAAELRALSERLESSSKPDSLNNVIVFQERSRRLIDEAASLLTRIESALELASDPSVEIAFELEQNALACQNWQTRAQALERQVERQKMKIAHVSKSNQELHRENARLLTEREKRKGELSMCQSKLERETKERRDACAELDRVLPDIMASREEIERLMANSAKSKPHDGS